MKKNIIRLMFTLLLQIGIFLPQIITAQTSPPTFTYYLEPTGTINNSIDTVYTVIVKVKTIVPTLSEYTSCIIQETSSTGTQSIRTVSLAQNTGSTSEISIQDNDIEINLEEIVFFDKIIEVKLVSAITGEEVQLEYSPTE